MSTRTRRKAHSSEFGLLTIIMNDEALILCVQHRSAAGNNDVDVGDYDDNDDGGDGAAAADDDDDDEDVDGDNDDFCLFVWFLNVLVNSSSSSGARSGTDIGDHASPNISVIRQLQKV